MAIFASDIQRTILQYYGEDSNIWRRMQTGQATQQEIMRALGDAPQVQAVRSADGRYVLGYDWAEPLSADLSNVNVIVEGANSNAGSYGYSNNGFQAQIPSNWGGSGSTGYSVDAGATIKGTGSTLATIADKASLAITGVNIGAKLGAAIDSALYNIDPEWWDTHYPAINPETWTSIAGQSETGKQFVRTLFGINSNGTTAYVDERVLAQTYQMLRDAGAFASGEGGSYAEYTGPTAGWPQPDLTTVEHVSIANVITQESNSILRTISSFNSPTGRPIYFYTMPQSSGSATLVVRAISDAPFSYTYETYYKAEHKRDSLTQYGSEQSFKTYVNQKDVYIATVITIYSSSTSIYTGVPATSTYINDLRQTSTIILDGTVTDYPGGIDGINPRGTTYPYSPTVITGTTLDEVLQQLKTNYPDLFTDAITETTLQDDGTLTETTYLPVPWAVEETDEQPITKEETEITEKIDDKVIEETVTQPDTDYGNPTDTGTGDSPTIVIPTGEASSLWAVYHPSQAQLNAFGAWLWSSDFVEQIKRLFNDPMQAIIGVHKVFAPIPTGGSQTIKCGYLDSGVSSPIVTAQYTNVDCGSVRCDEYFGNVFDYDPYTRISIYLPFIGVVPLKTNEVMRSTVSVSYGVDVITGACLAKVSVNRDGAGGVLYSYGGSCACHYPISSGSYAGIISGIITSAIGVAGGIATGSPLAAIGGVMAGVSQAHTEVQHSGGFTGCAGAMGPKKPYLIITRPQTRIANGYINYTGEPSNMTQFIGDCVGFVRCSEVHFSCARAYDDELKEVETLLKSGVLISD